MFLALFYDVFKVLLIDNIPWILSLLQFCCLNHWKQNKILACDILILFFFLFLSQLKIRHYLYIPHIHSGKAEWLVLRTLDHEVPGSNPAWGRIQLTTIWHIIAQSHSLSPFHNVSVWFKYCWKGCKTCNNLIHPTAYVFCGVTRKLYASQREVLLMGTHSIHFLWCKWKMYASNRCFYGYSQHMLSVE